MSDKRSPFPDHTGKATWGDRIVDLETFEKATRDAGRRLEGEALERQRERWLQPMEDPTEVEGPFRCVVVFGGVYSNRHALEAVLVRAEAEGADATYCLGDLGGFGPHPERVWPLLVEHGVRVLQGNYEQSLSSGAEDCNCGYTDPRDNHFAEISYRYTERHCSAGFKQWMGTLPERRRLRLGQREWLLVHGSPRRVNEFLFESTSPVRFLETLLDRERCDGLMFTHTGLHWHRRLPSGRDVVNVGVIGRPANDGRTNVWYTMIEDDPEGGPPRVHQRPLDYDFRSLAQEMRAEGLPGEFIETILNGWWTSCLEVLPARERERSKF